MGTAVKSNRPRSRTANVLLDEHASTQAICRKAQATLRSYLDVENLLATTSGLSQELEAQAEAGSVKLNASLTEVVRCQSMTAEDIKAKLDVIASVCNAFGAEYVPLIGLTLSTLTEVRRVLLEDQLGVGSGYVR